MEIKNRLKWIDAARGLAFLMVIYCHIDYCNSSILRFCLPILLTTFFFVSGYLYKEKSFLYILEQRTRGLLLPFLILGSIMILMTQIVSLKNISLVENIRGFLFQYGKNQTLWFVAALYVYSLAFYWIEKWTIHWNAIFVALILFVSNCIYLYWLDGFEFPWHISTIGFGCFYMLIGKLYKQYEKQIDYYMNKKLFILIVILYVVFIIILDEGFNFRGSPYVLDSLVITILGLIVCVYASKYYLFNNKLLCFVGANSLFYFAFHGKVYAVLQLLANRIVTLYSIEMTWYIELFIGLIIVLCDALLLILPAMFINRYFSWILGKGFTIWKQNK